MNETLFDMQPLDPPSSADPELSADRRRTLRQAEAIKVGMHPLSLKVPGLRLHPNAACDADRSDPKNLPYRCGSCSFRETVGHHDHSWPKCTLPDPVTDRLNRATHGPATDIRAWWPACVDYQPGDGSVSPDAARHIPEAAP